MDASSDQEIIREILAGNADLFETLVARHRERIFEMLTRLVPAESVPEVAHETFLQAYRSLASFRSSAPFEHWLVKIAVRRAHDYWRKIRSARETPLSSLSMAHREAIENRLSDENSTQQESNESLEAARQRLDRGLNQLSPADRMVVVLLHLEERGVREVAELLNLSVTNVKVRAHRARKKLYRIIKDEG